MLNKFLIGTMLLAPVQPYNAQILNDQSIVINLPNSNIWTVEADTVHPNRYEKSLTLKAQTYENNLIKIEQIKLSKYTENVSRQGYESYLFTRITPKIDINEISYYTNGNTQTYTDAESITQAPSYNYEFWRVEQTVSNEQDFDLLFELTSYNQSQIDYAYDDMQTGFDLYTETLVDGVYLYGNNETTYAIGTKTIIFMEMINGSNGNVQNPDFTDDFLWPKDYQFFYGQPYKTTILYNWYIDPAETDNYEVIDVAGLLVTILGMPMAWITQAFNFTLWVGTPYAINVGHVLSAIIIASVIIIILKKVYK